MVIVIVIVMSIKNPKSRPYIQQLKHKSNFFHIYLPSLPPPPSPLSLSLSSLTIDFLNMLNQLVFFLSSNVKIKKNLFFSSVFPLFRFSL